MIKLQGTLIERLEQALSLICAEAREEEVRHFYDIYEKAGIKPPLSAEKFFRKYGGAYRDSYIMLAEPKYNTAVFLSCYGNDKKTDNLDYAMQDIDLIREIAQQEVCPIGMIGYDIPAEVYIGENGLLYCRYDFKEEIDIFESPAQILEYYLKNNIPIGVDKKPIRKTYECMNMYKLETDNFSLELEPYLTESRLRIKVSSYGFSAVAMIDADELYVGGFSECLNRLYDTLKGYVKLEDLSTDTLIEFTAEANGHIGISGRIDNGQNYGHGYYHQLTFNNEFDQTCLRDFAKTFYADYGKYAE